MGADDLRHMVTTGTSRTFTVRGVPVRLSTLLWAAGAGLLLVTCTVLAISLAVVSSRRPPPGPAQAQCTSPACLVYAGAARGLLNQSADPCDDFYQYACAGFSRKHPMHPEDKVRSVRGDVMRSNERRLHRELWADVQRPGRVSWERKLKYYFRSCLSEESVQAQGGRPLVSAVQDTGGWDVITPGAPATGFAAQLQKVQVSYRAWAFFRVDVVPTPDNSMTNMVKLSMDGLGMGYEQYTRKAELVQLSYMTYMRTVGALVARDAGMNFTDPTLGVSERVDRFADHVYDFEKQLANATAQGYLGKQNQVMTLDDLKLVSNQIEWQSLLSAMFPDTTFTPSTKVMVDYEDYFGQLDKIIQRVLRPKSGKRLLNHYLVWCLMRSFVPVLSADYRSAAVDLQVALTGAPESRTRWEDCFGVVEANMPLALSSLYLRVNDNKDTHKLVKDKLVPAMASALVRQVEGLRWMDKQTKAAAKEKISKMKKVIGFSDAWTSDEVVDTTYKQLTIRPDQFFENTVSWRQYEQQSDGVRLGSRLTHRTDRVRLWEPYVDFLQTWNTLLVPAGGLQSPLVDSALLTTINLGSLGAAAGRALLGAVDIVGGHYSSDGSVTQWWTLNTTRAYLTQWACFVNEWNGTETGPWVVDGTRSSVKVNGARFARHAIADIGGLKQAYAAFTNQRPTDDAPRVGLPGFDKTSDEQLFFLAYAQSHCFSQRQKAGYEAAIKGEVPPNLRVNGALRHFPEFGRAYGCKAGSAMARKEVCQVF